MLQPRQPRQPRLCREIKSLYPSFEANEEYYKRYWQLFEKCEAIGLEDLTEKSSQKPRDLEKFNENTKTPTNIHIKLSFFGRKSKERNEKRVAIRKVKDASHVRDLKSQNYTCIFSLPIHLNPNDNERTGLCARNRLNGALRDHSNAVAIVNKAKPTKASNLQISRIPIAAIGTTEIAYQFTALMILEIAKSIAKVDLGDRLRDPMANGSVRGKRAYELTSGENEQFLMSSYASDFLENAPKFLTSHSFLEKSRLLAKAEIEKCEISKVVNQRTEHLRFTCFRIIPNDSASDGTRVWFAWSLLAYLAIDPRLHTVLETWGFTEYDLAIANSMLGYAKRLVGNRSRDAVSKMEKLESFNAKRTIESVSGNVEQIWKQSSARFVDVESDSENEDNETESVVSSNTSTSTQIVKLSEIVAATRVACTHELARKSRRIDTAEPKNPSKSGSMSKPSSKAIAKSRISSGTCGTTRVKSTLEFLHLHFSQNDGLLLHLFADTEEASKTASKCVLKSQLESKSINPESKNTLTENLQNASAASAMQTRQNIKKICNQESEDSPSISSWSEGDVVYTGLIRRLQQNQQGSTSNTRIHVCTKPLQAQPASKTHSCVVWCGASCTTKVFDENSQRVSYVMELFRSLSNLKVGNASSKRLLEQKLNVLKSACSKVLRPGENGITRSLLIFKSTIVLSSELLTAADSVARQIIMNHMDFKASRSSAARTTALDSSTSTPSVTPCNVFTVGLYLLECSRTSLNQIAPKQGLLAVPIAPESMASSSIETTKCKVVNPFSRPYAFLNVTDVQFEVENPERLHARLRQDAQDLEDGCAPPIHNRQIGIVSTFSVVGDAAMSVPSVLDHIAEIILGCPNALRISLLRQWRSVCYVSGIQCATFHQFSNSVAARDMNTKIEGTSKVDSPDNNYLAFPTISQAFVVGHTNLPVMFEGTPYQDTYGSGYECGAIASVGINGRMIVSDQRNAAFALMTQEQVDSLCERLAKRAIVVDHTGESFLRVPMADLGGLPRQMIPGVHLALSGLEAAFTNIPRGENAADCRQSIQILPFSPFSQAVAPVVIGEDPGMKFRDNARAAAFKGVADPQTTTQHARPLRTLKKLSILGAEFFQSVLVKMGCSASDNFFETIEPAIAPLLVFASQIAQIAKFVNRLAGQQEVEGGVPGKAELSTLRTESISFFAGDVVSNPCTICLIIDALVLFNSMFPMQFEVGKPCILTALAALPAAFFSSPTCSFVELAAVAAINDEDRAQLLRFKDRLFDDSSTGPWTLICEFVSMVSEIGSKFDNNEREMAAAAAITAKLGKVVWLLHSDDGVSPPRHWSPLHCRASPEDVIAADLVCVWTDRPQNAAPNRRHQRGALIGIPNAGPQQLLMLLTGAFLKDVSVQYFRNEGNMSLRMSSCALKDTESQKLTAKSTSPIYSDNDSVTFGSLQAKESQARRQVAAWHQNNELIFEVSTRFAFPRDERFNGANYKFRKFQDIMNEWDLAGRVSTEEVNGLETMKNLC